MGTNSEQFIRIPGTLHGDRALEDFSRDVRKALEALRDRGAPATGKQPPPPAPYCPLTPYFLRPDGADWLVNWRPGYVYQVYASDPGPVEEYEIYIGATALSNATPPDLDISLGDYIYLHFETKDDGAIKELGAPAGGPGFDVSCFAGWQRIRRNGWELLRFARPGKYDRGRFGHHLEKWLARKLLLARGLECPGKRGEWGENIQGL